MEIYERIEDEPIELKPINLIFAGLVHAQPQISTYLLEVPEDLKSKIMLSLIQQLGPEIKVDIERIKIRVS